MNIWKRVCFWRIRLILSRRWKIAKQIRKGRFTPWRGFKVRFATGRGFPQDLLKTSRWFGNERSSKRVPVLRQEPFFRLRNLIGDRSKELVYDRGNQDANFLITKASDRNDKNAVFSLVGGMGKTTLYRNWRYSSKPTREISHFQLERFCIFNSRDFAFSTREISHFQLERFQVLCKIRSMLQ